MTKKTAYYEILIPITYAIMAAVGVYLNFFSKSRVSDPANIIVNIMMFVIVAAIFVLCSLGSLLPAASVTKDLLRVTEKIEEDAKHTHNFLWEKYSEEKEDFFRDPVLRRQYQDYCYELERIVRTDKTYYKCDIEDYIGFDLIDSVIHRNRLNQVAGVMTGLGILGTFIGLSLGLQSFNTGTTAEITNSIEPLMGGIKVAFHTSIYGLVFSIVFNFVYKRRLDDAEKAVHEFISAYKKFVLPDTTTDGVNRLMELQQLQTEAILSLSDAVANRLSDELKEMLEPQFDRFNRTITDFANVATRNQMEQLSRIVDVFLMEMNRSLANMFARISDTINQTMIVQRDNEKQIQEIYKKNADVYGNIDQMARQTQIMVDSLSKYSEELKGMQQQTIEIIEAFGRQGEKINELQSLSESFPKEVDETFKIINENLQVVERHFLDTIEHTNDTINRMPEAVDVSYRNFEKALKELQSSVEDLKKTMQKKG